MKLYITIIILFTGLHIHSASAQPTSQNNVYLVGQKVEASWYNTWYKATILDIGSGERSGSIKVHYDDYSSASDQYVLVKNIRMRKETITEIHKEKVLNNYGAGPRNGEYTIRSYGGNIYNPLILGYFSLSNGKYKYYDAGKNLIGSGTYQYDANSKQVNWLTGELRKYKPAASFEISREGKTHTIQLLRGVPATNSTDSK